MKANWTKEQLDAIKEAKDVLKKLERLEVMTLFNPEDAQVVAIDGKSIASIRTDFYDLTSFDGEVIDNDILEDMVKIGSIYQCPDEDEIVFIKLK